MLSLKTILAPVDFSERTEGEVRYAADIARRFGSRLILLHVIPRFDDGYRPADPEALEAYSQQFFADVEKGAEQALQSLAGRVAAGVEAECVVLSGDPAEMIEELATSRGADLVVLPTAGQRGRVQRQWLGSILTHVLHDLRRPVLTGVHLPEFQPGKAPYKNIACNLLDGEDGAEQLLWARDFAAPYNGALHVVCVLPFLDTIGAAPSVAEPMREQALEDAKERLDSLLKREGVEAEVTVLGGPIEQLLAPYVRTADIDLLVSGRQRQQDTLGVFGLHTDMIDTVKSSPCPMVLV